MSSYYGGGASSAYGGASSAYGGDDGTGTQHDGAISESYAPESVSTWKVTKTEEENLLAASGAELNMVDEFDEEDNTHLADIFCEVMIV